MTGIDDPHRPLAASAFHAADGTADWRVVFEGACAAFAIGRAAQGAALITAIGGLADAAGHPVDVDLRRDAVVVRLMTEIEPGRTALTDADLALARQISTAARDLGLTASPAPVQTVQVAIDVLAAADVMPFWAAVLGYEYLGEEDLVDPLGRGPSLWFQDSDEPRTQRNRLHVDVCVPPEQAEARVAAGLAAGGRMVRDRGPTWWTLADPEGNEVDIATMAGRD